MINMFFVTAGLVLCLHLLDRLQALISGPFCLRAVPEPLLELFSPMGKYLHFAFIRIM